MSEDRITSEDAGAAEDHGDRPPGAGIVRAALVGTVVFASTSVAAVAFRGGFDVLAFLVAIGLSVAGLVAFVWAYVAALRRSRTQTVGVGAIYFLTGETAPPVIRRPLLGALAAQVVVGLATSAARPYTSLAAGTLVPLYGLGLCGLWSSRHGRFPTRGGLGRDRRE